jgi:hypothetical protein
MVLKESVVKEQVLLHYSAGQLATPGEVAIMVAQWACTKLTWSSCTADDILLTCACCWSSLCTDPLSRLHLHNATWAPH